MRHTWSSFRAKASCSKIERLIVSKDWQELNPNVYLKRLLRPLSDHCPLLFTTECLQGVPTPFRSRNMWLKHKSFKAYILSWRNQFQIQSWAAHGVQQKLQIIKQNPEIWNKKVFGSLIQQKASLTQRIDRSDKSILAYRKKNDCCEIE